MKSIRILYISCIFALAIFANVARAEDENPWKLTVHGFVIGTVYMQNQTFLFGQGAGFLAAAPPPVYQLPRPGSSTDKSGKFSGADVRNTRLALAVDGPETMGAKPKAVVDFDLFGNLGGGPLGYEAPTPRLREALAVLKWQNAQFDAGMHGTSLHGVMAPASLAHIVSSATYGAGTLAFRTIGIRGAHVIPRENWKVEFAAEVAAGKWFDANNRPYPNDVYPGGAPTDISLAWASKTPHMFGRVKAEGNAGKFSWMGWVSGSYQAVNLKGFGDTTAPNGVILQDGTTRTSISSYAVMTGARFRLAPVVLGFQGYSGRATQPHLGGIGGLTQIGDIGDKGGWAQLGLFATKELSFWGLYGASAVDKEDLQNWGNPYGARLAVISQQPNEITTLRKDNALKGAMIRYENKGYAFAVEYYRFDTSWLLGNLANDDGTAKTSAYQAAVSAGYFF